MRASSSIAVVLFAALAAGACAQPQRARGPDASPRDFSEQIVEVRNNSTVTVHVLCRRSTGHIVRIGTLGTGDLRRYEMPRGCSRVSAQTLSGRSVNGVVVRYLDESRDGPGTGRGQTAAVE